MKAALALVVSLVGACHDDDWLQYSWDDRRILCSQSIDDLSQDPEWGLAGQQLQLAHANDSVALVHAHEPARTITVEGLERFFGYIATYDLAYFTYDELVASDDHRAGVALALDDNAIESWYAQRELFMAHGARITFFVSRFATRTPEELAMLAQLAADGHSVQAHGVNHLNAETTVPEIGAEAYLRDEVMPSIELLREAGYEVTAYAYPFGRPDAEVNEALLQTVDKIRISPGPCPY